MQTAMRSTSSRVRRSWKHSVRLMVLVFVTAVAAAAFGLTALGAHPSPTTGRATGVDNLGAQREVAEIDEAAFAAAWAQFRAPGPGGAMRPTAVQVVVGIRCGDDCVTLIWSDGQEVTTSLSIALDYAELCGCLLGVLSPATLDGNPYNGLRQP